MKGALRVFIAWLGFELSSIILVRRRKIMNAIDCAIVVVIVIVAGAVIVSSVQIWFSLFDKLLTHHVRVKDNVRKMEKPLFNDI